MVGTPSVPTLADSQADGKGGSPELEPRPLLFHARLGWCLCATPQAGEATITHCPSPSAEAIGTCGSRLGSGASRPAVSHGVRAKGKVRRYCRANRLRFLYTLTYKVAAGSRDVVIKDLRQFLRRLQRAYGRLPLVAVIERGTQGTARLHIHFAARRRLGLGKLARLWGLGFVHRGDPGRQPERMTVGKLSRYLAKYVTKACADGEEGSGDRAPGRHRYLITQGWTPVALRYRFPSCSAALADLVRAIGEPDQLVPFGDAGADPVYGFWLSFPEKLWWPPPRGPGTVRRGRGGAPTHGKCTDRELSGLQAGDRAV